MPGGYAVPAAGALTGDAGSATLVVVAFVLGLALGGLLMLVSVLFVVRGKGTEGSGELSLAGKLHMRNLSHAALFFLGGLALFGFCMYFLVARTSTTTVAAPTTPTAGSTTPSPARTVPRVPTTTPAPPRSARAQALGAPVRQIADELVAASASVHHAPEAGFTYGVENTPDGNRGTAWNGIGPSRGATLTYTFDRPVRLLRIELLNGYAKSAEAFAANARLKLVELTTDARTFERTLADTPQWQSVRAAFGVTRRVQIRIESVYPGRRFDDAALTEIGFWGAASP